MKLQKEKKGGNGRTTDAECTMAISAFSPKRESARAAVEVTDCVFLQVDNQRPRGALLSPITFQSHLELLSLCSLILYLGITMGNSMSIILMVSGTCAGNGQRPRNAWFLG